MPSADVSSGVFISARRPGLSALHLTLRHCGGYGVPASFAGRLEDALTPAMRSALQVIAPVRTAKGRRQLMTFPSGVTPLVDASLRWTQDTADAIADGSPDDVLSELELLYPNDTLPRYWRGVVERPGHWLKGVAEGMRVANSVFEVLWTENASRLEVELHLLDQALETHEASDAIVGFAPLFNLHSGRLSVGPLDELSVGVGGLVEVVPMITTPGPEGFIINSVDGRIQVGYAMQGIFDRFKDPASKADATIHVLGRVRAEILRSLDRPRTLGDVAARAHRSPSTASFHAKLMVESGLVDRVEVGNNAWLVRTKRGENLLQILTDDF